MTSLIKAAGWGSNPQRPQSPSKCLQLIAIAEIEDGIVNQHEGDWK